MQSRVTPVQRKLFQDRIKKVNADRDKRTVWECIDKPIRPLVFELARVGMIPKFCCCGYTYQDEEEPKTHHGGMAYVHFFAPEECLSQFKEIAGYCRFFKWNLQQPFGFVWNMWTTNPVPDEMYNKADGLSESIHQYEGYGLKIEGLAAAIQHMKTVNDPVTIVDGNSFYKDYKTWMVKPKLPFTIGVREYYKKYGMIDETSILFTTDEQRLGMKLLNMAKINVQDLNTSNLQQFEAHLMKEKSK